MALAVQAARVARLVEMALNGLLLEITVARLVLAAAARVVLHLALVMAVCMVAVAVVLQQVRLRALKVL
jgi:hypothetical protein